MVPFLVRSQVKSGNSAKKRHELITPLFHVVFAVDTKSPALGSSGN